MKDLHKLDQYRVPHPVWRQDSFFGSFKVFVSGRAFYVLASVDEISKGDLWEHISVTPKNQLDAHNYLILNGIWGTQHEIRYHSSNLLDARENRKRAVTL